MPIIPKYVIPPNQFANSEETRAGSADNKAVTPRGLHAALRYIGLLPIEVPFDYEDVYIRLDGTNTPMTGPISLPVRFEMRPWFQSLGVLDSYYNGGDPPQFLIKSQSGMVIEPAEGFALTLTRGLKMHWAGSPYLGYATPPGCVDAFHVDARHIKVGTDIWSGADGEIWIDSKIVFPTEIATPTPPAANGIIMYSKDTGGLTRIWAMDSSGVEYDLLAVGGGGGAPGGSGDVVGPSASSVNVLAVFSTTSGKAITTRIVTVDNSGSINLPIGATYNINSSPHAHVADLVGPSAATVNLVPLFATTSGKAIKSSIVAIDNSGTMNIPPRATYNIDGAPHSHTNTGDVYIMGRGYITQLVVGRVYASTGYTPGQIEYTGDLKALRNSVVHTVYGFVPLILPLQNSLVMGNAIMRSGTTTMVTSAFFRAPSFIKAANVQISVNFVTTIPNASISLRPTGQSINAVKLSSGFNSQQNATSIVAMNASGNFDVVVENINTVNNLALRIWGYYI